MIVCKNCDVELDTEMTSCPLCGEPVSDGSSAGLVREKNRSGILEKRSMSQPQRKATWELVSIILVLIVVVTILLNFLINREISWSIYPVASCLILFSYISIFAFLNRRREIQILFVFVVASAFILLLDVVTGALDWSYKLAIPLLFMFNLIFTGMLKIFSNAKQRGINLIAYLFLGAALFSTGVEVITDIYVNGRVYLVWSLIIAGCVLPVVTALLFMHFRLKKGIYLKKTFHI
jgi:hypothetical protein